MSETCPLSDRDLDAWVAEHVMGWKPKGEDLGAIWFEKADYIPGPVFTDGTEPESKFRKFTFCHDLNFVARAEAKIIEMGTEAQKNYVEALERITVSDPPRNPSEPLDQWDEFELLTATARQRCEALWEVL